MTVFFIIYVFILSRTNQIVSFGKLFILLLSEGFMRESNDHLLRLIHN